MADPTAATRAPAGHAELTRAEPTRAPAGHVEPLASVLERSLGHLAAEVPDSYRHLVAEWGPTVVDACVDGEPFTVRVRRGELEIAADPTTGPVVAVVTTRAAILALLDATVCLADAVESDRLRVRGRLDDVLRAHDALLAYVHAAVRAPSLPGLVAALRGAPGGAR